MINCEISHIEKIKLWKQLYKSYNKRNKENYKINRGSKGSERNTIYNDRTAGPGGRQPIQVNDTWCSACVSLNPRTAASLNNLLNTFVKLKTRTVANFPTEFHRPSSSLHAWYTWCGRLHMLDKPKKITNFFTSRTNVNFFKHAKFALQTRYSSRGCNFNWEFPNLSNYSAKV